MVLKADAAAEALKQKGIDVEIVDLRSLAPLDKETILRSWRKQHARSCSTKGP
jgi:pyruvate/2-oxoglutarate/acetoin dehydrogenase E1 component